MLIVKISHLEADREREWERDEDQRPGDGGEEPAAQADAGVGLVRCKEKKRSSFVSAVCTFRAI